MTTTLPEIKISHHARATRLRLRVEPSQIRLTVPKFCTQRQIRDFLKQSEQWMIETWQKQQQNIALIDRSLPISLNLFNLQQAITIIYQKQSYGYDFDENTMTLFINDQQSENYLKSFVISYAKQHLPIFLHQISQQTGLKFKQCSIRQPKTRWGSCTQKHDIMLNSALALCDMTITRYVCVHELAHTRHFDHSAAFWAEVAKYDPNYQQHRQILKNGRLPWWWI
jgi:predicted metal-dependent hydrolase